MEKIKYILVSIEDPDNSHMVQFTDCETGKSVTARITGGESNIRGIAYNWDGEDTGWSESFYFYTRELKRREFNALWKESEYAGCLSSDIQDFIREKVYG